MLLSLDFCCQIPMTNDLQHHMINYTQFIEGGIEEDAIFDSDDEGTGDDNASSDDEVTAHDAHIALLTEANVTAIGSLHLID